MHLYSAAHKHHLPTQVCPSLPNWYPSSHSQRKVPGWLLQMAWKPQIWVCSLHSSMSDKEKRDNHHVLTTSTFCPCLSWELWRLDLSHQCPSLSDVGRSESSIRFPNYECFKIASVWNTSFLVLLCRGASCLVLNALWSYRTRAEDHAGYVNLVWEYGTLCFPRGSPSANWQDCAVPQEGRLYTVWVN